MPTATSATTLSTTTSGKASGKSKSGKAAVGGDSTANRHPTLKGLVFNPPLHRLSRAFHQSCHQYGRDLFRLSVAITTTSDRSTAKKRRLTLSSDASNPDNQTPMPCSCSTSISPVVVGFTVQRDSIEPR